MAPTWTLRSGRNPVWSIGDAIRCRKRGQKTLHQNVSGSDVRAAPGISRLLPVPRAVPRRVRAEGPSRAEESLRVLTQHRPVRVSRRLSDLPSARIGCGAPRQGTTRWKRSAYRTGAWTTAHPSCSGCAPCDRAPVHSEDCAGATLAGVAGARVYAEDGTLLSYGADPVAQYRRGAYYVDRTQRCEPGGIFIEQATTFEFVLNLKTAGAWARNTARDRGACNACTRR